MGHVELAAPVIHARYKNSPSGGIHQLLQLSANEIDKILSFVKYIVLKPVDEEAKKTLKDTLQKDYETKLKELDELIAEERANEKEQKKLKELEKLYTENKEALEREMLRLHSIVASLHQGITVAESDFRNFFHRF
jgi:DNA-directed RNA polymerase beta' subunit